MHTIGVVQSPFKQVENMPIQPKGAKEVVGRVFVFVKGIDCLNGTHLLDIKPAIMHELNS